MNELVKAAPVPVVVSRGGRIIATSRDVAMYFCKDHAYVCRSIQNLIENAAGSLGAYTFVDTPWVNPQNGQTYRGYEMDRDGFTLLAMGFTGSEALKFKLAYIAEFNRMEAALKSAPAPVLDLNNPAALRTALLGYTEKVLELEAKVEELAPVAAVAQYAP